MFESLSGRSTATTSALAFSLAPIMFAVGLNFASAATLLIGDVDNFGFTAPFGNGPDGNPADRNGDNRLTAGDTLPDINGNGSVASNSGDNYDNRSIGEQSDSNARWTDVTLSNTFSGDPGNANAASFVFNFTVPNPGDADFGVDHFINVVAGDLDTGVLQLIVDGVTRNLVGVGSDDGLITLTHVQVPWSDLLDGELVVDFNTPSEPYVVIDYLLLDVEVREATSVPVPFGASLFAAGLLASGIARKARQARGLLPGDR